MRDAADLRSGDPVGLPGRVVGRGQNRKRARAKSGETRDADAAQVGDLSATWSTLKV